MNVINTFSRNWFNLWDLFAVSFVMSNSRSMSQIAHFFVLIVVVSVGLHLYGWGQNRKTKAAATSASATPAAA